MSASRRRPAVALAVAAVVALGACAPGEVADLPPPPTTRPLASSTTTVPTNYAAVHLQGVSGRVRTTVALGPGTARLAGSVIGADGPVPGAVVRVERLVGDAVATADVTTGPDGRWLVAGLLGGRFRVRAWRSPDLAQLEPEVLFMENGTARELNLAVTRFDQTSVAAAVAPSPPVRAQPANVVVRVSRRGVDGSGIVRTVPSPRLPVQLGGPGQWAVVTPNPAVTDASGSATWAVVCLTPGDQPLVVTVGQAVFPLDLPPCVG